MMRSPVVSLNLGGMSCEAPSCTARPSVARRLRLGRPTRAQRGRAVLVAGLVGTAGVATGADPAWLAVLPLGIGIGKAVGWATARRDSLRRGAHQRLEAELHTVVRELRESRARLAHVADAERRRIERDLHDGCQQRLIAMRIKLALAEELVGGANESVLALIQKISEDAESALKDLHALVHGIYPSILVDRGLADALKANGRAAPMSVRVRTEGSLRRYPADVEAAVYFACAEALQNVAKHAGSAATACIALRYEGRGLEFEVSDDGRGFGGECNAGGGLVNMEDRLNAVGGGLRVTSVPGCGTPVQGWVGETSPSNQTRARSRPPRPRPSARPPVIAA